MKLIKRLVRLVLFVGVIAVAAVALYQTQAAARAVKPTASYTQVVAARQGSISNSMTVVGELEAVQQENLTFSRMNGTTKLLQLDVKAGNTVKAGQVLATIDAKPYQQAVDQARSSLLAAENKLANLKAAASALSLSKADLAIAQAELRYQQAQNDRDDVLKPDLAKLRSDLEEARRALSQARVSLVELQTEKTTEAKLWTLREAEAKASAEYSRLATETYRDSFYEDRRYVAYNKLLTAQDARVTAEVQQKTNLLKAETQVRKAEATLAAAEKALATALAGGDKLALGKAELAVKEAEVSLATARTARADLLAGTDAATLTAAQADVDKKRLALGEAEAALAGTKLTAPFDGTVLRVPVRVGSTINQSTQILTLANLKSLQVVASVDETTIRRVQVGQNTTVTFDAVPGQTVRGRVTEVPLQGALQGNVMVYEVPISLTGADALPLLVGMTANVQIQTAQAANAVLVPAVAVKQNGSAYQVMLANGDDPNAGGQAVDVEIGLSDGTNTQIVRGLKAGDKVLVQYTARTTTTTSQQQQNQQFGQQFGQQPGQIPQGGQIPGGIPQPGQGGR